MAKIVVGRAIFRARLPLIALLFAVAASGCSSITSAVFTKEKFRGIREEQVKTVPATEKLPISARVEGSFVFLPEARKVMGGARWMYGDTLFANDAAGTAEFFRVDMIRSGIFASVVEPNRSDPDIIVRVDATQGMLGGDFQRRVVLSVLDPKTGDVVSKYEREGMIPDAIFQYMDAETKFYSTVLPGLRADLASDYRKRGGRFVSTRRYLLQADEQAKAGDYRGALGSLREALRAAPKEPEGYAKAASLLVRLCDPEGAARVAEEGLKFAADNGALKELSVRARAMGVENLPDADPAACRAQVLHREGVALAKEGKSTEALGKFEAALATSPASLPKARYNIALLLERAGRAGEAVSQLRAAQREFLLPGEESEVLSRVAALARRANLPVPESADHRYRIGVVRAQQKKYAEAVREFEAALQGAPWFADAYYNLGLVADQAGEPAKALSALRTYRDLAPQSPNLGAVKTKIVELEDKLGLLTPAGSSPIAPPAAR